MTQTIDKQKVINEYKKHDKDTGSEEVQVALLSARISHLTGHLRQNPKDFHSRRGLITMTNRRRKLLRYLKSHSLDRYNAIVKKLQLRH